MLLPSELEALASWDAALAREVLRTGFKSYTDAEREEGRGR
jgi:hypothetical protein